MYTNIPGEGGTVHVTVEGEIWESVGVTPRGASFGRLTAEAARSSSLSRKLTVVNNMEDPANLTNVRCTSPAFEVATTTIEPGKKYELTVTLASSLRRGNNSARIEASTGIKEKPTLSIPVSVIVMGDIDVRPDRLVLAKSRPAEMNRSFTVQNNTKQAVRISALNVSNPALRASLQELRPGMTYRITVSIPADFTVSPGGDKITLKTDCPTAPEITIPVTQIATRRKPTPPRRTPPTAVPKSEKGTTEPA